MRRDDGKQRMNKKEREKNAVMDRQIKKSGYKLFARNFDRKYLFENVPISETFI